MMPDGLVAKKSHLWDREPDNWYVEPVWCAKRLFQVEPFNDLIIDPCAGMGNIMRAGDEVGVGVCSYDLRDRGFDGVAGGRDFFSDDWLPGIFPTGNIVSNPPYGKRPDPLPGERGRFEEEFIRLALLRTRQKVAVLLDANWICGSKRGAWLQSLPLYRVYVLSPRPSMPPGTHLQAGGKASNGTKDYAWFVFLHGFQGDPTIHFLRRDENV